MTQKTLPRTALRAAGIMTAMLAATFRPGLTALQQPGDNAPPVKTAPSKEAIRDVQRLQEKRVMTVTGKEDWTALRGFGKDDGVAEMMTLMMVSGSGMEHMKMGPMKAGRKMAGPAMAMPSEESPLSVTVTPDPPIVGENTLDVAVTDSG